jgi:phosphoglycolate phosphatase
MKYTHLFWDWNGTLANDAEAAYLSVNALLEKRGMPPITFAQYYEYVDTPIIRFYERLFDLDKVDYEEILRDFTAGYERFLPASGLREHADEVLRRFRQCGLQQAIISSCEQNQLTTYTGQFGIAGYFDAILGAANFHAESKIERAAQYMREQAIQSDRILFIGDTLHDLETAQAIGADCVLITAGHQNEERLRTGGVPVIHTLTDLYEMT